MHPSLTGLGYDTILPMNKYDLHDLRYVFDGATCSSCWQLCTRWRK